MLEFNLKKQKNKKNYATEFERKKTITGILFILPTVIICFIFIILPLINVFHFSFYEWNGISKDKLFVGINNFVNLPKTEGFGVMFGATFIYSIGVTLLIMVLSFFLAIVLDQKKGKYRISRGFLRACWFFPCLLSGAIVGILWRIMYNYNNGLINSIIELFGGNPVNWLETYGVTMFAIIFASAWSHIGLCIIIFLAGLQSIPTELYEAAIVDGASESVQRRKITFPLMAQAITINVLTTSIWAFKAYELPLFISQGLPGYSTRLLTQRIYFYAFQAANFGTGSALSVLLILIITFISLIELVYLRKREDVY